MNRKVQKFQHEIIRKLNQQGGELDIFTLCCEYHQNERVLVKKALACLEAENRVNINYGQVTQVL
ncbi:MAG: hypothetical protein IGS39_07935 [Calothrix sp. C42_A2020_038]|nr:hypothetical protein [Calothrix sp. C42_A2020_038]